MAYIYKVSQMFPLVSSRRSLTMMGQGMTELGQGSDQSGSVLLSWHEKVGLAVPPI